MYNTLYACSISALLAASMYLILGNADRNIINQYNPQIEGCLNRPESTSMHGELTDDDIMKLVAAVNMNNIPTILSMMSKAADNNICRSFVAHTVSALRNIVPPKAYKLIADIFDNLGTTCI